MDGSSRNLRRRRNSRDFTYIANVVDANIKASQTYQGIGEVMNAANGERISLNELLEVLKKITDKSVSAEYQPARKGDVKHSQADNRGQSNGSVIKNSSVWKKDCKTLLIGGNPADLPSEYIRSVKNHFFSIASKTFL